ncbi:MAG TPA: DUF2207 domain-containing protein [Vicinamibacterales bacterium]|nr:DUF2207 domain-containing protein [Vicinamibacterales bacterium]
MRLKRVCVAFILLCSIPAAAEAKTYSARRFDSDVRVRSGGLLEVTETVVFTFENGTFSHVFREIPARRTDGVEIVRANMDGRDFPVGTGTDHVEVSGQSKVRVTWRFEPVADSTHTFTLIYVVRGVIEQTPTGDLLAWRGLPTEHAYRIDDASVTLRVPGTVEDRVGAVLQPHVRAHRVENQRIEWRRDAIGGDLLLQATGRQVGPNGWLEASANFPPGSLISEPPAWQQRRLTADRLAPKWITAAVVIGFGGLILLFGMRQQYDAPPRDLRLVPPALAVPDDLPPHLAGTLAANGRSSLEHAMAAVFGLADRGVLTIVEEQRGIFGQRSFQLRRIAQGKSLSPAERALLDAAFGGSDGDTVALMTARRRIGRRFGSFSTAVRQELRAAGLLDDDRNRVRQRYNYLAVTLIILASAGLIAAGVLARTFGLWPMLIPGAVMVVAIASLIATAASTPLTNDGLRRAAAWRSFGRHLRSVAYDRDRLTVESPTRVLPFAVTLGLAGAWSKYMRRHPSGLPSWFRVLSTVRDDDAFPAFIAAGGGGGGPGGAGGAGAAGGGASGAG